MIRLYTAPGSQSCRKAKSWFNSRNMPFVEKNILSSQLAEEELREFLQRSENGTDDIVSKRCKVFQQSAIDIDGMSTAELISFIQKNPAVLKRPIIMDERRFIVGYNDDEIRAFIPRDQRTTNKTAKM